MVTTTNQPTPLKHFFQLENDKFHKRDQKNKVNRGFFLFFEPTRGVYPLPLISMNRTWHTVPLQLYEISMLDTYSGHNTFTRCKKNMSPLTNQFKDHAILVRNFQSKRASNIAKKMAWFVPLKVPAKRNLIYFVWGFSVDSGAQQANYQSFQQTDSSIMPCRHWIRLMPDYPAHACFYSDYFHSSTSINSAHTDRETQMA